MDVMYTLRHPFCNIVKFTRSYEEAEKHRKAGWCVTSKLQHDKTYKHSNNNVPA